MSRNKDSKEKNKNSEDKKESEVWAYGISVFLGFVYAALTFYALVGGIKNAPVLTAVIASITTLGVAVFVSSLYKKQKEIDAQFKGKEFLMQKRIEVYTELKELLSGYTKIVYFINYEGQPNLNLDTDIIAKINMEIAKDNARITNVYTCGYERLLENQGLAFVSKPEEFEKSLEDIHTILTSKGVYMSIDVQYCLHKLLYIVNSCYASYIELVNDVVFESISIDSGSRKRWKGVLAKSYANLMCTDIMFYIETLDNLLIEELNNVQFKEGGVLKASKYTDVAFRDEVNAEVVILQALPQFSRTLKSNVGSVRYIENC